MTTLSTSLALAAGLLLSSGMAALAQDAAHPDSCASTWGPDDEIGAANHLSPALAMEAAKLIKTGKTYSLAVETNTNSPAAQGRSFRVVVNQPGQAGGVSVGPSQSNFNEDVVMGYVGVGTQIDGLGHIGIANMFYNCRRNSEFVQGDGLRKLGVETIPPLVTRGVLLDMAAYYGVDMMLDGTSFGRKEIREAAERQQVEIRPGDVVIFHTGWQKMIALDRQRFIEKEPGINLDGARFLIEQGVVAVGADTLGVEAAPGPDAGVAPVHLELIPKNGVYILEMLRTDELAADRAWEFMFVLGVPKISGGVQAIVNPVAIR